MNDDEARAVSRQIRYRRAAEQREQNKEIARITNQKIMEDKRLVAAVIKDLEEDFDMQNIARKHGIPHFSVIHIWRSTCVR